MNEEKLRDLANQLDADTEEIIERWQGRPDRIIDDLFRVRDIDTGETRDLELFDVQRKVAHAYFYGDAGVINTYKGRRIGYSFVFVACFLLEGIFYPDSFYPLVSRSLGQAKNRIEDIQNLIDNAKVEIPTVKENTDYIELWNGTAFMAYSSEADTSRGDDSARAVLMDEMAFMEDEMSAYRAFFAFLSLGENRKMVEVSTPNTKNDLFMQEHRSGSPEGENGIISIKQPTFKNADEIDIERPLFDQEVEPVRPDFNLHSAEIQRKSDPQGFAQEYLCRPVSDQYRFFDEETILAAQERDETEGTEIDKPHGAFRTMGIDIGINRDDTVLSVVDKLNSDCIQRAAIVVDDDELRKAGVVDPDRGNANHIAELINYYYVRMDVDRVILDKGGVGETFQRIIEQKLGRGIVPFDFSDKEAVADMFADLNVALRDGNVSLVDEERVFDELSSIVKEKRDQYQTAKFSGKDYSESGKDDVAMATVLSAFPPGDSDSATSSPVSREHRTEAATSPSERDTKPSGEYNPSYGATTVSRTTRGRRNRYKTSRTRQ